MIRGIVQSLRVRHWTKNLICFAGVVFGDRMGQPWAWGRGALIFVAFCGLSSTVYLLNDVGDREHDRAHERKRARPIASGAVPPGVAIAAASVLAFLGLALGFAFGPAAGACGVLYLAMNLGYTLKLKHEAFVDVLFIALGFILRLLAGVYVLGDIPTVWIVLCTLFLALFLAFCKRHGEVAHGTANPASQRPVLARYSARSLEGAMDSAAAMTVLCYALFTGLSGKNPNLVVTVPIVYYAVMRYRELVLTRPVGEEPENVLLRERSIQVAIVAWMACYLLIVHGNRAWFRTH